ncbi:MAG: tetratricopeptide repeat protein [Nitrospinota bacterium]|nr:MAG: tetratricopeptide repeat protein [Nitrospinota bacterium]
MLGAVFRTASSLADSPVAGGTALLLAASSAHLARWTTSGMETVGFAALLALANQQLVLRRQHSLKSSLFFGLAVLTRPNGVLHGAVAFLLAAVWQRRERRERWQRLMGPAFLFLALPLAHLLFRWWYYGLPLPNTFYAKLGGDLPSLVPAGLLYLQRFLLSGGMVLIGASLLVLLARKRFDWILLTLVGQVGVHLAYVVWVGGDYFPFHRFIVPVIPALAVLAGVGLEAGVQRLNLRREQVVPVLALLLSLVQVGLSYASLEWRAFKQAVLVREERELVAAWLKSHFPADALLAINVAGVIPYRTGMPTVDMLGLNDRHIARAPATRGGDGTVFVGHFKHDGTYVCSRAPDVVVTSGGYLHPGRNAEEAIMQAALNTFPGDREFLRAPACQHLYRPLAEELRPGRFLVVYQRQAAPVAGSPSPLPTTAKGWFEYGLSLMQKARLQEAIQAFKQSLRLNPDHPAALTNLGFCFFDLQRYDQAIRIFEQTLRKYPRHFEALYGLALSHQKLRHRQEAITLWRQYLAQAPESPWKVRAREHFELLTGNRP